MSGFKRLLNRLCFQTLVRYSVFEEQLAITFNGLVAFTELSCITSRHTVRNGWLVDEGKLVRLIYKTNRC